MRWSITVKRGPGEARLVFLVGRYAIKIPNVTIWRKLLSGLLANMNEVGWWRDSRRLAHADPDHRLCPILFWVPGGWLVVMQRAYVPRNFYRKFTYAYTGALGSLFAGLPFDHCPSNFGFIGRHLVLVDYG